MNETDNFSEVMCQLSAQEIKNLASVWIRLTNFGWIFCIFFTTIASNLDLLEISSYQDEKDQNHENYVHPPLKIIVRTCRGIAGVVNILSCFLLISGYLKNFNNYFPYYYKVWAYVTINIASMNLGYSFYVDSFRKLTLSLMNFVIYLVMIRNIIEIMGVYKISE